MSRCTTEWVMALYEAPRDSARPALCAAPPDASHARAGRTPRAYRSESPVAFEQRLAARLLDFERLGTAWPQGRTAIKRVAVRKAAKPG